MESLPGHRQGQDTVQSSAELLLEINSGDADRAIADAERLERDFSDHASYSPVLAQGHWWMVQLRIRSIEKNRASQG